MQRSQGETGEPGNLTRFLAYVRPYRGRLVLSTIVGVVKYNLPVVFPWIIKDVIDNLLQGKPSRLGLTFDQLMVLSLVLFALYAAITYIRTHLADRLAHAMIFDVRRDLFRHLQKLPLGFFQEQRAGAVSSRLLTDVSMAQNFVGLAGTNIFMDLTSLISITCVVFLMNWKLALVACSTLPIYFLLQRSLSRRMRANAKEARRRMEILEGTLHETVSGISEVKSFTGEEDEERRFVDRSRSYLQAARENVRAHSLSLGTTALLTRIPSVVVIWIGGHLVLKDELTVGALMAFYAYLEMVYNPITRLSELNIQLANSRAAIDRLFELFDEEPEETVGAAPAIAVRKGDVEFENVVFGYRAGSPVFQGICLSIASGQRVALVGPSGAGKSTLIKLLIRFHVPWEGRIVIDGQDIGGVSLQSLRSQIALVQQDPVLFSGSVEDNIRLGPADATLEEIREAAGFANALGFIEELPDGVQTEVGERGVTLSGGQKQRIAISRAFLKNAPILVLDESTSNLDAPSEELVYEALERLMTGRTTIIIAHRLSTVARADRVIVLDKGNVVEQGAHDDLILQAGSVYHHLYRSSLGLRDDEEGRRVGLSAAPMQ